MAFQVGGIGQHQVGVGHHLRLEGVGDDQERDFVVTVFVLVVQHLAHLGGVHRRVPGHVGHEDQQRVDAVGIAAPGVGDGVVHQAVHRQRVLPGKRLVDAHRLAVLVDEQVVWVGRPAERHAVERRVGLDVLGAGGGLGAGRNRARERRLVAEAAGPVDGAENAHQDGHGANGLEAVGVRGQTAHGVESHRVAGHRLVIVAPGVGPGDRQLDLLVARGDAHFVRQALDGCHRDTGDLRGPFGVSTA